MSIVFVMTQKGVVSLQWLRSLPPAVDVVCFQETHCSSSSECNSWFASSGFLSAVSPGSVRSCGCVILFRPVLSLVSSYCDADGRSLLCEFAYRDKSFRVACIYAPNRNPSRDSSFGDVSLKIGPFIPTVPCGDFNTVFDRSKDRIGSIVGDDSRESSVALSRLFDSCCVLDIWRYLHPQSHSFTWSKWNGLVSSRIDLFGCPYSWVASVSSCDIVSFPFSDHCAVLLSVSVPDVIPPGPGMWKFNVSVLEDPDYVQSVTDFWNSWRRRQNSFESLSKWWEVGKAKIII